MHLVKNLIIQNMQGELIHQNEFGWNCNFTVSIQYILLENFRYVLENWLSKQLYHMCMINTIGLSSDYTPPPLDFTNPISATKGLGLGLGLALTQP